MRVIIQRVREAKVTVEKNTVGQITKGLLVLLGIEEEDTEEDINWLTSKIVNMRIFQDREDKMNLSLLDVKGDILLVSQFTLHALTKKGNRPSFIKAANPEKAENLYEMFKKQLNALIGKEIQCGIFGAMMDVSLINHGPVTIFIDSKARE